MPLQLGPHIEDEEWQTGPGKDGCCAFCGKARSAVQRMIRGSMPQVLICDECISLSMQLIADLKPGGGQTENDSSEQQAIPLYLGTIQNWTAISTDDLITRFKSEKAAEKLHEERRMERFHAIFQILRSRNMDEKSIWQRLRTTPIWQKLPGRNEFGTAWKTLEEIYTRRKEGKVLDSDDLDAAVANLIESRKRLKITQS
jgi:hypothetical protein